MEVAKYGNYNVRDVGCGWRMFHYDDRLCPHIAHNTVEEAVYCRAIVSHLRSKGRTDIFGLLLKDYAKRQEPPPQSMVDPTVHGLTPRGIPDCPPYEGP